MAYACCMLLLMLHSTINELLVLHKILLLTVKSSLGNQSREEHLTWKKVGLLRIFLFGLVFFFFKKCLFLLIVWNEEGEITALAMAHSSSTSFLYWHFTLEAAFIPLSIILKADQKVSIRTCVSSLDFWRNLLSWGSGCQNISFLCPP